MCCVEVKASVQRGYDGRPSREFKKGPDRISGVPVLACPLSSSADAAGLVYANGVLCRDSSLSATIAELQWIETSKYTLTEQPGPSQARAPCSPNRSRLA